MTVNLFIYSKKNTIIQRKSIVIVFIFEFEIYMPNMTLWFSKKKNPYTKI